MEKIVRHIDETARLWINRKSVPVGEYARVVIEIDDRNGHGG